MPIYSNYTNPNSELYYANEVEDAPPPPSDENDTNQNTSTAQYGSAVQIQLSPEAQAAVQTQNSAPSPPPAPATTPPTSSETVVVEGNRPIKPERDYMDGLNLYAEAEEIIRERMEEDAIKEAYWAGDQSNVKKTTWDGDFSKYKQPIPKGFTPVNDENKFMKDANGKYFLTPAYEAYLKDAKANDWNIDWTQVKIDLLNLGLSSMTGPVFEGTKDIVIALAVIFGMTVDDLHKKFGN